MILFLFSKMSRTQSFTSTDKEKNPPTPRSKIGHRRVDETGETTYKKASVKKTINLYKVYSYCLFWVKVIWSGTHKGHMKKVTNKEMKKEKSKIKFLFSKSLTNLYLSPGKCIIICYKRADKISWFKRGAIPEDMHSRSSVLCTRKGRTGITWGAIFCQNNSVVSLNNNKNGRLNWVY